MKTSLIIVDDFLQDPMVLREAALRQEYPELGSPQNYPGRNSKYAQIIQGFDQQVAEIIGEKIQPADTSTHARFRLALDGEKGKESVHIDPVNWTVLLYLTLPEHCQGGTLLFRNIETGSDHAPYNQQELKAMGYTCKDRFMEEVLYKSTNNPGKWELLTTIPMRFNRLVILRPQQYHDAGVSFGDCPENGRLIYVNTYY